MRASRRDFLGLSAYATAFLAACTGGKFGQGDSGETATNGDSGSGGTGGNDTSVPPNTLVVSLTDYPKLTNVGGQAYVKSAAGHLIVAHTADTTFVALSSICTHAGCSVTYMSSQDVFYCPCHGSEFADSGKVKRGPANRALQSYAATFDSANNRVLVTLG